MVNSIQHFQAEGTKNLQKVFDDFSKDLSKMAEMVYGVTEEITKLGLALIAEELESYDELLRKKKYIRKGWYIVKRDETTLTTSLGDVTYKKTLFLNKKTGVRCYLLDELMGLESHTRITEDAVARILDEAVESSYRKGGENVCITGGSVSKMTVMNKIHSLSFPKINPSLEKKKAEMLYIDADEDHVSLQYMEKKGVKQFWDEIYEYIEASYDTGVLKQIYINGDGAAWIKAGTKSIAQSKFVLDKYHMHKYMMAATAHLKDSAEDARSEIYRAIYKKKKWMAEGIFDKILAVTEKESKKEAVQEAKEYILGNWSGIIQSITNKDENIQCSAEGHVSHIYADRMSSRPLGWSKTGADRMSRLRIYRMNGGDMLSLVRYQKKELPVIAGAEEVICSAQKMLVAESENKRRLGEMADIPVYEITLSR